ncbi:MAG: Rrf2 family transcriptional regulator [Patescibacteria group bacterium]|nr:MAG: Rrf2 family transcriptional regulator [Patescibacteria group bacterium]
MPKLLTTRGDYGLLLVTYLAREPREEPISLSEIASHFGLSQSFLEQIAADLRRARLIFARRGKDGGYFLVRDPSLISVIEVLEALEGPLQVVSCQDGTCLVSENCSTRDFWMVFQKYIHRTLREITVADLLDQSPHKLLSVTYGGESVGSAKKS